MLGWLGETDPTGEIPNGLMGGGFLVLVGFAAFLFSQYNVGMAKVADWRLLRATGSYMLVSALFVGAMCIGLIAASQGAITPALVIAWILPVIQLVLAAELAINFVLDLYRPRLPGQEHRPPYDSRLFNLIAEPSRVGHSIAETLNYQFGFEVSRTWFYELVAKACVPLVFFGVIVMLLMSSIVMVDEGEEYLVKRFGRIVSKETLKPGLRLKLPWPIDTAERFDTGKIHEIRLGLQPQDEADPSQVPQTREGEYLLLWSQEHGLGGELEKDFLIGSPPRSGTDSSEQTDSAATAVNIIKLVVVIHYQVDDPYKFGYSTTDTPELLQSIAEQEMTKYCARATLQEPLPGEADRPDAIMTTGREEAASQLKDLIQKRVGRDGADLGVKITWVGIVSAHPPAEVTPEFEKVLQAERAQDEQRYEAEAEASRILAEVSGDPGEAMQLYLALRRGEVYRRLASQRGNDVAYALSASEAIREADQQLDALSKEIRRERLLGRTDVDLRAQINLRDGYQRFLENLQAAKANPAEADLQARIAAAEADVQRLFERLEGEPATLIAEAEATSWARVLREQTALETYQRKLKPFQAAPQAYKFDRYMDVLEEHLPGMMKYVLGLDRDRVELRLNLEQTRQDALDAALGRPGGEPDGE
jgi:regulator of protease activity HflC (stomatin/prohibitin superfamily)